MKMSKINERQRLAILDIISAKPQTVDELMAQNRQAAKRHGAEVSRHSDIIEVFRDLTRQGKVACDKDFERLLRRRAIRTMSGIAPVAVLTMPFACPGKCAYCPTEKDVPQSYLSNEPAVMRAIRCDYDPYIQVTDRLRALVKNGHEPSKIELIVIGGTWSVLPGKYKYWYILNCYKAANDFGVKRKASTAGVKRSQSLAEMKKQLALEQERNERARYRIIGLTLETRPDYIDDKELLEMRQFGCTRVELGVQAIDDKILGLNKRGHGVAEIAEATARLRSYGFKITYHLMPGLPGSTPAKDLAMFKQLWNDERFQPDQIKFYPTVVTKGSLLYEWWRQGTYRPYTDKQLEKLIVDCKQAVPPYVRIIRLIRDIPGESIIAGNKITNLRQVMQQRGIKCSCIRCREAKEAMIGEHRLNVTSYGATRGRESFIEITSPDCKTLYGFCRLRLPDAGHGTSAMVRELHIYGELVPVGSDKKIQHAGLGKALLEHAEKMARQAGYAKMSIIAGVGVRGYYRKFGYRLKDTYMAKKLG